MKQIFYIFISLLLCVNVSAQTKSSTLRNNSLEMKIDSIYNKLDTINHSTRENFRINLHKDFTERYKIYPTDNIYIFLKLDTRTGLIRLIQWSLEDDKEFSQGLNFEMLNPENLNFNGMFELYPTKNMFQFILLNKLTGETWHVQWGFKTEENIVRQIF